MGDCCLNPGSPIILDIGGEGFALGSVEQGVLFDIRGTGFPVRLSWTLPASNDAWLVLDRNGNGRVDNGTEMFGNQTPQLAGTAPNGFLALAEYDKPEFGGNLDGWITQQDAIWTMLRLWRDANHNAYSEPDELLRGREP